MHKSMSNHEPNHLHHDQSSECLTSVMARFDLTHEHQPIPTDMLEAFPEVPDDCLQPNQQNTHQATEN